MAKKKCPSLRKEVVKVPHPESVPVDEPILGNLLPEAASEASGEASLPESAKEVPRRTADAGTGARPETEGESSCADDKQREEEPSNSDDTVKLLGYDSQESFPSLGDVNMPLDHDTQELDDDEVSLIEEGVSPGKEGLSPGKEGVSPGEEGVSPDEEGVSSGREGMSPGKEGMSPGDEGMSPGKEGVSPGEEAVSPGEKGVSPGNEGVSQGEEDAKQDRKHHVEGIESDEVSPAKKLRSGVNDDAPVETVRGEE